MTAGPSYVNRTPVQLLWAAVVAERLGYPAETALTLGKAVSAMYARQQLHAELAPGEAEISLLGRYVPVAETPAGLRATNRGRPYDPEDIKVYLESKFGAHLAEVRTALDELAASYPPERLAGQAYKLYQRFKPAVAQGWAGWGTSGILELERIWELTL
ncbi:MAG: hypothetical protein ACYC6L_15875 [Anaerolineae bacterium]